MGNMIQVLFVGGVGLSVSAIVTWGAYLTLLVFDIDKEQVGMKQVDSHIEYRVDEVEEDIEDLIDRINQSESKP